MAPKRNCPRISRRYFHQDYPGKIQFVFGVQDPNDSAIPVVRSLIARYPELDLQLVVNAAAHGSNRKVSNLINMAEVARHSAHCRGRQRRGRRSGLSAHVGGRAGAAWRWRGDLPLSRPAQRRLLVAAVRHGGARSFPARPRSLGSRLAWRGRVSARRSPYRKKRCRESAASRRSPTNWPMITPSAKRCVQAGLNVVVSPMLVAHAFEENSLHEMIRHELRWARTIFTVDPVGYIGSGLTHALAVGPDRRGASRI